jgi:hypothetical protein
MSSYMGGPLLTVATPPVEAGGVGEEGGARVAEAARAPNTKAATAIVWRWNRRMVVRRVEQRRTRMRGS